MLYDIIKLERSIEMDRKEIKELAEGADVHEVVSIYCEDIPKARKVLFEKFKEIYKD